MPKTHIFYLNLVENAKKIFIDVQKQLKHAY